MKSNPVYQNIWVGVAPVTQCGTTMGVSENFLYHYGPFKKESFEGNFQTVLFLLLCREYICSPLFGE